VTVTSVPSVQTTLRITPRSLLRFLTSAAVLLLPGCVVFTCRV
jgi:hypothetical protein